MCNMNGSIAISVSIFVTYSCFITALCQVIVNSENNDEGSLCYTINEGQGLCREACSVQNATNDNLHICNPGKLPILYCCVEDTSAQLYPTLHESCMTRLLASNLYEKRKGQLTNTYHTMVEFSEQRRLRSTLLQESCEKDALELELAERSNFLKFCHQLTTAAYPAIIAQFAIPFYKDPSIAGIGFYDGDRTIRWVCGGHFIHTFYVLTSASCVRNHADVPNVVRFGFSDLNSEIFYNRATSYTRTFVIEEIITRDDYSRESLYGDIALLKVVRNPNRVPDHLLQMNPIPACLWTKAQAPTENLTITGYTDELHEGVVSPTNFTECARKLNLEELDDTRICLVCDFENEGPITASLQYEERGLPIQIPYLVAMGSPEMPCKAHEAAHFTLVYPHLKWIESIISRN